MQTNSTGTPNSSSLKVTFPGLNSMAFHIPFGILVALGILGNTIVLVWNCWRKETRYHLLTVLVSSLALADLLFSVQYLLQVVIVVQAIVTGQDTPSETDGNVFLSMTFIGYTSCNAIMVTTVAISLHSYLSVRGSGLRAKVFIVGFVVLGWLGSLGVAVAAVMDFRNYSSMFHSAPSVDAFVAIVVIGHVTPSVNYALYPMIVTAVNALASIVCTFFYFSLWRMVRKKLRRGGSVLHQTSGQIHTRLFIIVTVNLLGWWPPCIEFLYTYTTNNTVLNGRFPVEATIPVFVTTAAACAANPIIYTITSKSFIQPMIRSCFIKRNRRQPNTAGYSKILCCRERMAQNHDYSSLNTEETELWA
jgi:hypothetical protein